MLRTEKQITAFLFLILLILNAVLRFYDISNFSLSNDELSAISRLNYSSFSELILKGVIATDPHPAGVQVFLFYWTSLFGKSVLAIRLPFVLSSLVGIFFLFKTMSMWFSSQRALLITAFFSLTEFSLIQGQLARPYAMAMMFVLIFLWSWTHLLYSDSKQRFQLVVFIVSAVLASISHYFAALMIGIIGLAGIFPAIGKKLFKHYLLLGLTILFLCTVHLPISIGQFSKPSLTSWISMPEMSFIIDHISLLLNNNLILKILAFLFFLVSLFMLPRSDERSKKFMLCSLLFFISPLVIAYVYSVYSEPVLMHRVLYFSSPFFYAFILALIPDLKLPLFGLRFSLLTVVVTTITLFQTNFLERDYVENFKGLSMDYVKITTEHGNEEVTLIGNFNSMDYMHYYLQKNEVDWHLTSVSNNAELAKMMEVTRNSEDSFLAYFWACKYQPPAVFEYANRYYPSIEFQETYYNSGTLLFSKNSTQRNAVLDYKIADTMVVPEIEYLNLFKDTSNSLIKAEVVNVKADFYGEKVDNTLLVFSLVDINGKVIKWEGVKLADFKLSDNLNELFYSFIIPEEYSHNDALSIYFWNPGKNKIDLQNLEVKVYKEHIGELDPQASIRRP